MSGLRVLVCGGRDYDDLSTVVATLDEVHAWRPITSVIQGGASGADDFARYWAERTGVPCRAFRADWTDLSQPNAVIRTRRDGTRYDARAGTRRNQHMIDEGKPDLVVAFPGGPGTADMVRRARAAGIPVTEVPPTPSSRTDPMTGKLTEAQLRILRTIDDDGPEAVTTTARLGDLIVLGLVDCQTRITVKGSRINVYEEVKLTPAGHRALAKETGGG